MTPEQAGILHDLGELASAAVTLEIDIKAIAERDPESRYTSPMSSDAAVIVAFINATTHTMTEDMIRPGTALAIVSALTRILRELVAEAEAALSSMEKN